MADYENDCSLAYKGDYKRDNNPTRYFPDIDSAWNHMIGAMERCVNRKIKSQHLKLWTPCGPSYRDSRLVASVDVWNPPITVDENNAREWQAKRQICEGCYYKREYGNPILLVADYDGLPLSVEDTDSLRNLIARLDSYDLELCVHRKEEPLPDDVYPLRSDEVM